MNGKFGVLSVYTGLILLVALVQSKLIENETFVRSLRNTTDSITEVKINNSVVREIGIFRPNFTKSNIMKYQPKFALKNYNKKPNRKPDQHFKLSITEIPVFVDKLSNSNIVFNEIPAKENTTSNIKLTATTTESPQPIVILKNTKLPTEETIYTLHPVTTLERKVDPITNFEDQNTFKEPRLFYSSFDPENVHTISRSSIDYINYKQAYGIRYDPHKTRRSFNFSKDNETETDSSTPAESVDVTTMPTDVTLNEIESVVSSDSIEPTQIDKTPTTELPTDIYTNDIYDTETTQIPLPTTTLTVPLEPLETLPNATVIQPNSTTTNIMVPSRVHSTIQLIKNRVKHLFSYGLDASETANKNGQRFLNIFNVIQFRNVPCSSQKAPLTPLNGTCYNQDECDRLGGVAVDGCAGGFGVCCVCKYLNIKVFINEDKVKVNFNLDSKELNYNKKKTNRLQ